MEQELKQLGLGQYEVRVYLTLLKEGSKKGGEVSRISGVPHGKTYEALEHLQRKGFVAVLPIKPKVFSAIPPNVAIAQYSDFQIQRIKKLETEAILESKNIIKASSSPKTVTDKFMVIKGFKNERQLSKHAYGLAQSSMKTISTYEYISSQARQEALSRGVSILQIVTNKVPEFKKKASQEIKQGMMFRYYPLEELRMKVVDGKTAMIGIVNSVDIHDRVGIFIESEELSKALESYFDALWKKAKKLC